MDVCYPIILCAALDRLETSIDFIIFKKGPCFSDLLLHRSCLNFVNWPFLNRSKFELGPNMYRRLKW